MEAEQPTSEEKNAVLTLARNPSHGSVGAGPQALGRRVGNDSAIDSRGLVHIASVHQESSVKIAMCQMDRRDSACALRDKAVLIRNRWESRLEREKISVRAADLAYVDQDCGMIRHRCCLGYPL